MGWYGQSPPPLSQSTCLNFSLGHTDPCLCTLLPRTRRPTMFVLPPSSYAPCTQMAHQLGLRHSPIYADASSPRRTTSYSSRSSSWFFVRHVSPLAAPEPFSADILLSGIMVLTLIKGAQHCTCLLSADMSLVTSPLQIAKHARHGSGRCIKTVSHRPCAPPDAITDEYLPGVLFYAYTLRTYTALGEYTRR